MGEQTGPDSLERARLNYTPAFLAHLTRRDERSLRTAYEVGRDAMAHGVSMLDLVHIHHTVLLEVAGTMRSLGEVFELTDAAAAFLLEALAPYAMTQRQPLANPGQAEGTAAPNLR